MKDRPASTDVVVIGAGIIGCACALSLADRGLSVAVVERNAPGTEATWAAGGMLSPLAEAEHPGPFLDLGLASFARYDAFIARIEDATDLSVDYATDGKLQVALDEAGRQHLVERQGWLAAAGLETTLLDGDEARRLEPALSPLLNAALMLRKDHRVDNRLLGRVAWIAARQAGVRFVVGRSVERIERSGDRVAGVGLDDGRRIAAETVVLAAGAWSAAIEGLPRPLPVFPVRGQMIALETQPPLLRHVIGGERCYIVPRATGRIVVGSTMERTGFTRGVTAGAIRGLIDAVVAHLPSLEQAPLVETWSGFRPATPDELPVLGPDPALGGLVHATGHYRNGILLAPITGELIAQIVTGEATSLDLTPFAPDRFPDDGGAPGLSAAGSSTGSSTGGSAGRATGAEDSHA